jgi:F-type H+-transporting ATPase subunit epsilon
MADKLELEIVTPEKPVLREVVDEVIVPGLGGELGILPDHTPLISQIQTGILTYRSGDDRKSILVSGGFVEVLPERVSVLVDIAERAEEIDVERAMRARERAEKRVAAGAQGTPDIDVKRAQLKLERAIARIELGQKQKATSA